MNVTKEQMKTLLIRDKSFLKDLYEGTNIANKKRLIMFASDEKLDTLLKFLHFLATGQISLQKNHFEQLSLRIINLLKRNVEKKPKLLFLIESDRNMKVKFLLKLCNAYNLLLDTLFSEM